MTSDQQDPSTERANGNGVLSESTSSDTAGLGLLGGSTAQVNVSLAFGQDDDDLDDDIIDGEVVIGDGTVSGDASAHPSDDTQAASATAFDTPDAADASGYRESEPHPETAEAEIVDEPEDDLPATHPAHGDIADADEVTGDDPGSEEDRAEEADATPVDSSARTREDEASTVAVKESTMDETRRGHPELALRSKRLDQFDSESESADLLTPDRLLDHGRVAGPEPEGGWQHFVYSLSRGRINLGDGKRARARKAMDARIAAPLNGGARFVPVLSRKGGVGKTTITTLLGMALADARDDRVIAIDANPDRGTLAERIARPSGKTVRDLVRIKGEVGGYNDVSDLVTRDQTRLDVLASDADPRVSEAFSDGDYDDVATLAAHYYSLVLTDTGTGIVHAVMGATLARADQLVIVAGLSVDEARLASETLTWLETNGYAGQVRNAVVVLNHARPGAPLVRAEELETHFSSRVRAVVQMPYDAAIATGSAIGFRDLAAPTREAARELAATVVEGLRSAAAAA